MYRSEAFLTEFHARCTAAATRLAGSSYEIILVNDGSPDQSLQTAIDLHARDPHVRVIDLSRNFGHHKALMTGLAHARGELVFLIDCDLEEDPAWLLTFHDAMRADNVDVVYGVQAERKGDWLERIGRAAVLQRVQPDAHASDPGQRGHGAVDDGALRQGAGQSSGTRAVPAGLWVITGFEQRPITVQKGSRPTSSYTTRKRLSVFANAITSFSNRPLIYIFQIGMAVMALSVVAALVLLYMSLNGQIGVPGWASIMVSIWFLGGLIIFCVGVIGMYLAKIFTEIKQRPYTIVRAEYGSEQASPKRRRVRKDRPYRPMSSDRLRGQARDYYETKLRAHGPTPAGVDWNSQESQELRFALLANLWRDEADASILDYGCGYGALADYLRARGHRGAYVGFDVSEAMAQAAHARVASLTRVPRHRPAQGSRADRLRRGQRRLQRQAGRQRRGVARLHLGDRRRPRRAWHTRLRVQCADRVLGRRQAPPRSLLRRPARGVRSLQAHVFAIRDAAARLSALRVHHHRAIANMAKLVIFGAGDIARLAHHYFTHDSPHEVAGVRRRSRIPARATSSRACR